MSGEVNFSEASRFLRSINIIQLKTNESKDIQWRSKVPFLEKGTFFVCMINIFLIEEALIGKDSLPLLRCRLTQIEKNLRIKKSACGAR